LRPCAPKACFLTATQGGVPVTTELPRVRAARGRPIDGRTLKRLTEAGLAWLKTNQQTVNALNVFPVPDGDTGTNMVLTMQAAWTEIKGLGTRHIGEMAAAVSKGALMGARGNSGVILSQLWRGFSRSVRDREELDGPSFAAALAEARDTAYKGVVRPVEGTILTVAKEAAAAAEVARKSSAHPIDMLEAVVQAADEAVQSTPELLPVLKQAGVVDSGGKGLFYILEGMLRHIRGESLDEPAMQIQPLSMMQMQDAMQEMQAGQDYEVVVDFYPKGQLDLRQFYGRLEAMGTSIQVGEGEGMYRMHIHVPTEKRYEPIDYVMELGTISKVAIENLVSQMESLTGANQAPVTLQPVEPGTIAVVAVSPGPGLSRIFASLGVAAIVEGGQTMNPSTQDILRSFENLPTDRVILLPNNKNIVMAAEQAREVTVKHVAVVPSRTVPQGLAAMLAADPQGELEAVADKMKRAMASVKTGEITIATRSVEIDGVAVKQGQVIALLDGKLVVAGDGLEDALLALLDKAGAAGHELVSLYHGQELPHAEAHRIGDVVRERFPDVEVEIRDGGQPHYQMIVSVE
jgi:hypothetical protein